MLKSFSFVCFRRGPGVLTHSPIMLKSFTNMVSGLVKSALSGTDPYEVVEINFKDMQK